MHNLGHFNQIQTFVFRCHVFRLVSFFYLLFYFHFIKYDQLNFNILQIEIQITYLGYIALVPTKSGSFFIDRDGTYFHYVLNYLRTGELIIPENKPHLVKMLLLEAEFYQVYFISFYYLSLNSILCISFSCFCFFIYFLLWKGTKK